LASQVAAATKTNPKTPRTVFLSIKILRAIFSALPQLRLAPI
jgi:hypothetical protein